MLLETAIAIKMSGNGQAAGLLAIGIIIAAFVLVSHYGIASRIQSWSASYASIFHGGEE